MPPKSKVDSTKNSVNAGEDLLASSTSPSSAVVSTISLNDVSILDSLESLWSDTIAKAQKGMKEEDKQLLANYLQDGGEFVFKFLREHTVAQDNIEIEPLNRELAETVEKLEKEADELALAVKEARESCRKRVPDAMKKQFEGRSKILLSDITVPPVDVDDSFTKSPGSKRKRTKIEPKVDFELHEATFDDKLNIIQDHLEDYIKQVKELIPKVESSSSAVSNTLSVISQFSK